MAFFGITALGPPSAFGTSLANALGVIVFTNEEYVASFRKFDRDGSGFIERSEVEALLFDVYGFPPLEKEVELFMEAFDLNSDGKISLEEFVTVLDKMREKCKTAPNKAVEYDSHWKMTQDRFKHSRIKYELPEKFKAPVTSNQTFGFHTTDEKMMKIPTVTEHRIKQCEITKYAAELVRTGFI